MSAYDPTNVFAKILRGELPAQKLYEDAETLAIMDIMPWADGHCLIIPKTPARNILDAAPEQLAACIKTTQRLSKAVVKAFAADGCSIRQNNETSGGQDVFHLHFHVIPRHADVKLRAPNQMEKPDILKANADKIRAVLASL